MADRVGDVWSVGGERLSDERFVRLFVALWPTPETRDRIAGLQQAVAWPAGSRVVTPQDLHVTLAFIGAVPAGRVGVVRQAATVPSADIALSLDQVELWENGTAAVLTSSCGASAALAELRRRITTSLANAGVQFDQTHPIFAPHVTLARRAGGAAIRDLQPIAWQSVGHVLASSVNGPYKVVAHFY